MPTSLLRARYRRIIFFFGRIIASLIFWEMVLPRIGLGGLSRRSRAGRLRSIAVRFRALAIQMGGVLIKVGQFLSTRLDVLPPEVTEELSGLQDEVPPVDFEEIRRHAELELGAPLNEKYAFFDKIPLAAASLGQVHRAQLYPADALSNGEASIVNVVVKVQRPHIEELIDTDLTALRQVARFINRYQPIRKRADVLALTEEFATTIHQEIDYLAEGQNAETFAANFTGHADVRIPRVVWSHTTRCLLTLEDVFAIKITDYSAISAAGIDRAAVAKRLFEVYLQQIFEDGFFHADPHPGNLFVSPLPEQGDGTGWQLTFVDFGMVGRVASELRDGLRETVIAVGTRDTSRLVKAYQLMGVLLPGADLKLLERAEMRAFEALWGKSMGELRNISRGEINQFTREFRELLYTMPFQIPNNLLMLGRTVAILSGMCTGLDPQFNVWEGLAPYARKLVAAEAGGNLGRWIEELGKIVSALLTVPGHLDRVMSLIESGEITVQIPQVSRQIARLETAVMRLFGGVVFAALLVSGQHFYDAGERTLGSILVGGALIILFWAFFIVHGDKET